MRIYTDGSCLGNPGPGGWAWAVSETEYNSGYEPGTTNQRMEMTAVIEALRWIGEKEVTIVTDSAYIVNCFKQKWHEGWTQDGHKKRDGAIVANWDLWLRLFVLIAEKTVVFEKVKGHSGDRMNDFVDKLAVTAARTKGEK